MTHSWELRGGLFGTFSEKKDFASFAGQIKPVFDLQTGRKLCCCFSGFALSEDDNTSEARSVEVLKLSISGSLDESLQSLGDFFRT